MPSRIDAPCSSVLFSSQTAIEIDWLAVIATNLRPNQSRTQKQPTHHTDFGNTLMNAIKGPVTLRLDFF
jgi:hypothetical protein